MINNALPAMAQAMAGIHDGAVGLVGGFDAVGHPYALIEGLIEQGARDLTIVANNAGWTADSGLPKLVATR